jgi:hypothetical protein
MSNHVLSLQEIDSFCGRHYTSCELSLLQEVFDKVESELEAESSPPISPDALTQARARAARAIMDLAEAGIRSPETLKMLALKTVGRHPHA